MSELTPEDLAFLKKIGQIKDTPVSKSVTTKKDEE
jgi:hypothetical protein